MGIPVVLKVYSSRGVPGTRLIPGTTGTSPGNYDRPPRYQYRYLCRILYTGNAGPGTSYLVPCTYILPMILAGTLSLRTAYFEHSILVYFLTVG